LVDFDGQQLDATGSINFGTDRLTEQQEFVACGLESRLQQHVPEIRFVIEQRQF